MDLVVIPLYKNVLDYGMSAKIDMKGLHQIEISKYMPAIVNINESVVDRLCQAATNITSRGIQQSDIIAIQRRLSVISFGVNFKQFHAKIAPPPTSIVSQYTNFEDLEMFKSTTFNFLIAYACINSQLLGKTDPYLLDGLQDYAKKCILNFSSTHFGQFYIEHRDQLEKIATTQFHLTNEGRPTQNIVDTGNNMAVQKVAILQNKYNMSTIDDLPNRKQLSSQLESDSDVYGQTISQMLFNENIKELIELKTEKTHSIALSLCNPSIWKSSTEQNIDNSYDEQEQNMNEVDELLSQQSIIPNTCPPFDEIHILSQEELKESEQLKQSNLEKLKFLAPGQRIKKEIQDAATILLKKRLYNKKITANSDSKIVHSDVIDIDNLEPVTKKLKFE